MTGNPEVKTLAVWGGCRICGEEISYAPPAGLASVDPDVLFSQTFLREHRELFHAMNNYHADCLRQKFPNPEELFVSGFFWGEKFHDGDYSNCVMGGIVLEKVGLEFKVLSFNDSPRNKRKGGESFEFEFLTEDEIMVRTYGRLTSGKEGKQDESIVSGAEFTGALFNLLLRERLDLFQAFQNEEIEFLFQAKHDPTPYSPSWEGFQEFLVDYNKVVASTESLTSPRFNGTVVETINYPRPQGGGVWT